MDSLQESDFIIILTFKDVKSC